MKGYLFSQNWDMKGPGFVRNLVNLNSHTFLGLAHTTPEEFESGVFALKTHQIFSVQTTPEEVKTQKSPAILDLRFRKIRSGKSHEKLRFQSVLRPHENEMSAFSISFGLLIVFEKLRFQNVFRPRVNEMPAFSISFGL